MRLAFLSILLAGAAAAEPPPAPESAPINADDVYQAGKQLFDQFAPPEVKQQVDFPSKDQINDFLAGLQRALDTGSFQDLAADRTQATAVLAILRAVPDYADEADWLAARLEEIDEAKRIADAGPAPLLPPARPTTAIPYYDAWLRREHSRAAPANAAALMPELRRAFASEGVPPELAWLAEVESSFNPTARSPSGARGLYQFKADTAHDLGLSTFLPDDRTDPQKSAQAAARYLHTLGHKFGSWPLAFAAYNAGEGRVSRLLASHNADNFSAIASSLPGETRMYVPEVCAVIATRTGIAPENLPRPR